MSIQQFKRSKASIALDLIDKAIINGEAEKVHSYLSKIKLENLSKEQSDVLFKRFSITAMKYNQPGMALVLSEVWSKLQSIHSNTEDTDFVVTLFYEIGMSDEILDFYVNSLGYMTFIDAVSQMIPINNSNNLLAFFRADRFFGQQTPNTYEALIEMSDGVNGDIYYSLKGKLREVAPYAERPLWLRNFFVDGEEEIYDEDKLPLDADIEVDSGTDLSFEMPTVNEMVDLLYDGLTNTGINIEDQEEARSQIKTKLNGLTLAEKINVIRPFMESEILGDLETNAELFRMYGPANPFITSEELKYGGSRMFLAYDFDYIEGTEEIEDWFIGACQQCDLKVERRWHAVRIPHDYGGWSGCFCSWECVKNHLNDLDEEILIRKLMVDYFEEEISKYGIQDRL